MQLCVMLTAIDFDIFWPLLLETKYSYRKSFDARRIKLQQNQLIAYFVVFMCYTAYSTMNVMRSNTS